MIFNWGFFSISCFLHMNSYHWLFICLSESPIQYISVNSITILGTDVLPCPDVFYLGTPRRTSPVRRISAWTVVYSVWWHVFLLDKTKVILTIPENPRQQFIDQNTYNSFSVVFTKQSFRDQWSLMEYRFGDILKLLEKANSTAGICQENDRLLLLTLLKCSVSESEAI